MDAVDALRRAGPQAVLSHGSAAAAWGIETPETPSPALTVPRSRSRLAVVGYRVHRCDLAPADITVRHDLRVTTPLRTVLDLARTLPLGHAVAAADSALRQRLVTLTALLSAVAKVRPGRGSSGVRALPAHVDPQSGSVLESLLRVLLAVNGLRPAATQYEIRDRAGLFVARVDFCWPQLRLVVEADGYAYHADRESYRRDRERLNTLEQLGWRVLRFTWEDVVGRPDYVVALVREVLATAA